MVLSVVVVVVVTSVVVSPTTTVSSVLAAASVVTTLPASLTWVLLFISLEFPYLLDNGLLVGQPLSNDLLLFLGGPQVAFQNTFLLQPLL